MSNEPETRNSLLFLWLLIRYILQRTKAQVLTYDAIVRATGQGLQHIRKQVAAAEQLGILQRVQPHKGRGAKVFIRPTPGVEFDL